MANRLSAAASGGGNSGGPMKPGDVRTVPIKDFKTGADTGRFLVITRTHRPYVEDLCDAYNAARTNPNVEWYVTERGELKLGTPERVAIGHTRALDRQAEDERQRWIARHRQPEAAE